MTDLKCSLSLTLISPFFPRGLPYWQPALTIAGSRLAEGLNAALPQTRAPAPLPLLRSPPDGVNILVELPGLAVLILRPSSLDPSIITIMLDYFPPPPCSSSYSYCPVSCVRVSSDSSPPSLFRGSSEPLSPIPFCSSPRL